MHRRLLPLVPALLLGPLACELGAKNLSDPGIDSATAGASGSSTAGPGSTGGHSGSSGFATGDVGVSSGFATTGDPHTGGATSSGPDTASGSSGHATTDPGTSASGTGGPPCQDPLQAPGVTKQCQKDADCAVVFHQVDCCGSLHALGVHLDAVDPFNDAEAVCAAAYPQCDCAPMPTVAEDGDSTEDPAEITVSCVDMACQTAIPDDGLQWYSTCGDPVCTGYSKPDGVPPCTPEQMEGLACDDEGFTCDPMDACNALLVCAAADPKQQEGGCPISRARFKTDIEYLKPADLERLAADLQSLRLATYRYRQAPPGDPPRLGIILEDNEHGVWVDARHDRVDLYGYASLAVAALQVQQRQIDALKAEVERLSAQLEGAAMCRP